MSVHEQQAGSAEPADQHGQSSQDTNNIGSGLLREAKALYQEYRLLARDHLHLAALETRQAGETVVRMVATGIVAGGVAATAWVALVGALVAWVVENSWLKTSTCLLIIGLVHIVVVFILATVVRRQGRGLLFSAFTHELDPRLTGDPRSSSPVQADTASPRDGGYAGSNTQPLSSQSRSAPRRKEQ